MEVQGQAGQAIQDLPVNPVGPKAYTPVEKDDMIENLVALYNANKDVTNRLRVLKIIEGMMLKNEAMAKFLIREDFCQGNFFQKIFILAYIFGFTKMGNLEHSGIILQFLTTSYASLVVLGIAFHRGIRHFKKFAVLES